MFSLKRSIAAPVLAVALTASLQAAAPAVAVPATTGPPPPPAVSHAADQVTLLTGDMVVFDSSGSIAVQPAPGRVGTTFLTEKIGEEHYVLPADVLPLLANGTLDRRLFNVTLLRDFDYDTDRGALPLIVTRPEGPVTLSASLPAVASAEVTHELGAVGGLAVQVAVGDLAELWRSLSEGPVPGTTVALDGLRQPALEHSVPQVGAPKAWDAGLDGAGVQVAVLDTGVDQTHPDLGDQVVASKNFTSAADGDTHGHGTHVASTVAGTGTLDGRYQGVAPGAGILAGKVCHEDGCPESAILAGMQWAVEQGATVVNLSLGGPQRPGTDPVEEAVETLTAEHDALFVAAAGNDGGEGTVESPATADSALAVGAVDRQDNLAWFSSQGPRRDGALKPEISAPGVGIIAAVPGGYAAIDGTSMATPHVSGAAAILAQQHPDYSASQLKAALMGSAAPQPEGPVTGHGAGRLDLSRGITQTLTTDPPSVSFTRQEWPHGDPEPVTVTYRNRGDRDQTLALTPATAAPDGMFTLSDDELSVPAGGSAGVTLTVDVSATADSGYFGGQLVATADGVQVSTPFGIEVEPESYDLTLVHRDRSGDPTMDYRTVLQESGGDTDSIEVIGTGSGGNGAAEVTLRVPAGEYALVGWLEGETRRGDEQWTTLVDPALTVAGDMTVDLDARAAALVDADVPGRSLVPASMSAMARYRTEQGWTWNVNTFSFTEDGLYLGHIGDDEPAGRFSAALQGTWAVPGRDGRVESATEVYHVADVRDGRFFTGFDADLRRGEMAVVRNDYAVQNTGSQLTKADGFVRHDPFISPSRAYVPFDGPAVRTEYYTTGADLEWRSALIEQLPTGEGTAEQLAQLTAEPVVHRTAGGMGERRWNYGVFGPSLDSAAAGVHRNGDRLLIAPRLFDDIDGNQGAAQALGAVTVSREGEQIARRPFLPGLNPVVDVPPDTAEYQVEVDVRRAGAAQLSTEVNVLWTFESAHVEDEVRLPVPVVRLSPSTDGYNSVPDRRPWHLSVEVETAAGPASGPGHDVTLEASFDDGDTWQQVPVRPGNTGGTAKLSTPAGEGYVSLRASASDGDGNSVEQTVLRAYRFGH